MQDRMLAVAARRSDADLLRRVMVLAGREREATVELVAHLAELDARRLHLGEGFGSLFSYCTGALRLSEHAAYNRIEAARASRRLPAILDLLADGSLNLSTVRLLAPHLRPDNFESLVSMAKRKSKREVEALVARLAPRPDVAASVRKLPAPVPSAGAQPPVPSPGVPPPVPPGEAQPLGPTAAAASATRVAFTGEPAATPGASRDPAPAPRIGRAASTRSRHIPARVMRAVWLRDGGRCAFVAPAGRRCNERAFLEFHHREPYAIGGEATVTNIALRCRQHNAHEGELAFGSRLPGVGGEPAGRHQRDRVPAELRGESIRPNSPRGELDTS